MPPVIAAIAAVITSVTGAAYAFDTIYSIVSIALVIGGELAINAAEKALAPRPKSGKGGALETNYVDTESSLVVIAGSLRVGGMHTIPPVTYGPANNGHLLAAVYSICGHKVAGFFGAQLNDAVIQANEIAAVTGASTDGAVSTAQFVDSNGNQHCKLRRYNGAQSAVDWILNNSVSATAFPASFIGKGITYCAAEFWWDPNMFQGVPTVVNIVQGALVYDPRLDSTNGGTGSQRVATPSTWAWDDNPALFLATWLISTYGGDYDSTEISWPDVITAANNCDALVTSKPVDTTWNNSTAVVTFSTSGGLQTAKKSGGVAATWDTAAVGKVGATQGSVSMSPLTVADITRAMMCGIHTSSVVPTPVYAAANMLFCAGSTGGNTWQIYELGVGVYDTGLVVAFGDVARIDWDLTRITYFVNEIAVRTVVPPTQGATYFSAFAFFDSSAAMFYAVRKRWTINAMILANDDFVTNLKQIAGAMLGRLIYANGMWRMFSGGWTAPLYTINENDWVGAGLQFTFDGGRDVRFNRCRVWFVDPNQDWQRVECYPRSNATYQAADGAEWIDNQTDQPYCTVENEAQMDGEFILRASRNQVQLAANLGPRWQRLQLWDTVAVNHAMLGWVTKTFRVVQCSINIDTSVSVVLQEEQSTDWTDLATTDYNAKSKVPLPTINPTTPGQPTALGISNNINGTLDFSIGPPVIMPLGMKYQVGHTPTAAYINSGGALTLVYDGASQNAAHVTCPTSICYYWTRAYIQTAPGSYNIGPWFPNSSGVPGASVQLDKGQLAPNVAASLVNVTAAVNSNGFAFNAVGSLHTIINGNISTDSYSYGVGIDFSANVQLGTLLWHQNSLQIYIVDGTGAKVGTAAFDVSAAAAPITAINSNQNWSGIVTLTVIDAPATGVNSYRAVAVTGVGSGSGANVSGLFWSNPALRLRQYSR